MMIHQTICRDNGHIIQKVVDAASAPDVGGMEWASPFHFSSVPVKFSVVFKFLISLADSL